MHPVSFVGAPLMVVLSLTLSHLGGAISSARLAPNDPPPSVTGHAMYLDGDLIGYGDELSITSNNRTISEYDVFSDFDGTYLWTAIIDPGCTEVFEVNEDISIDRLDLGRERDDVDGLCGINCFAVQTQIQTPRGPRAVEDLCVGDLVLDGLSSRPVRVAQISKTLSRNVRAVSLPMGTVHVSGGHRFVMADGRRVCAQDLLVGGTLVDIAGREVPILAVRTLGGPKATSVFQLTLEGASQCLVGADQVRAEAQTLSAPMVAVR